jgi:hypothetical protein
MRIDLNVKYSDKETAKKEAAACGLKLSWDPQAKAWWVNAESLPETLKKYEKTNTCSSQAYYYIGFGFEYHGWMQVDQKFSSLEAAKNYIMLQIEGIASDEDYLIVSSLHVVKSNKDVAAGKSIKKEWALGYNSVQNAKDIDIINALEAARKLYQYTV